ncbi:hypothetical protein GQX74_009252 [Glossina fuscipes]|nr:hypothetical protein GQX74_009252 [Glossina fuscipes]
MQEFPSRVLANGDRFIADQLIESKAVDVLQTLIESIIKLVDSRGGASTLDLHSKGNEFVNVYKMSQAMEFMKREHLRVYRIREIQHRTLSFAFDISYLFSQLTNCSTKSVHDEYWREQVESVLITSETK